MPKKQTSWVFINMVLTPEEKEAFSGYYAENEPDMILYVEQTLQAGYKLSHRLDDENGTWMTTIIGTQFSAYNTGTSMTSRHSSFVESVMLTMYKHHFLCHAKDWRDDSQSAQWG